MKVFAIVCAVILVCLLVAFCGFEIWQLVKTIRERKQLKHSKDNEDEKGKK